LAVLIAGRRFIEPIEEKLSDITTTLRFGTFSMSTSSSIPSNNVAAAIKEEGDILYRDKRYQAAVAKYSKAIELLFPLVNNHRLDSDTALQTLYVSYSNRCACFLQLNSAALALRDAQECVRLKPDWPKGYLRLGSSHTRLNQTADAIAAYEQVLLLDSNNQEARNALNRLRSGHTGHTTSNPQQPSFFQPVINYIHSINWLSIRLRLNEAIAYVMSTWLNLTQQTRNYIQIACIALIIYYFFFYRSSPEYYYTPGYDSYSSYNYSSSRGLTWTTWGLIMFAGYKLPPMFPEQLGPYARPFFGMNFTTFMWLVNMISRNSGNGLGGMGSRGMGYGHNRRRYY